MKFTSAKVIMYVSFAIFVSLMIGCDSVDSIVDGLSGNDMPIDGGPPAGNLPPIINAPPTDDPGSPGATEPIDGEGVPPTHTSDFYNDLLARIAATISAIRTHGNNTTMTLIAESHPDVELTWDTDDPMAMLENDRLSRPIYTDGNESIIVPIIATLQAGGLLYETTVDISVSPICRTYQDSLCSAETGTHEEPYRIHTLNQLQVIRYTATTGKHFVLARDIDAAMSATWNDDNTDTTQLEGFLPIGTASHPFAGTFDGGGLTITNLTINREVDGGTGLFAVIGTEGYVHSVRLTGLDYTCQGDCGGLSGTNLGTIEMVRTEGRIDGNNGNFGGLVGLHRGHIVDSEASVAVIATGTTGNVGGLAGSISMEGAMNPTVTRSAVYDLSGEKRVSGGDITGGFAGLQFGGTISDSYARIATEGDGDVGGFIGRIYGLSQTSYVSTVSQSYAAGPVTGGSGMFGSVVFSEPAVIDSYWDTDATGQTEGPSGYPRTTAQMRCPTDANRTCEGATTYTSWLDSVWDFGTESDYPTLR